MAGRLLPLAILAARHGYRQSFLFLACCAFLVGCQGVGDTRAPTPAAAPAPAAVPGQVSFAGGDGNSIEPAVLIKGAPNESVGVSSEYKGVRDHARGLAIRRQSLLSAGGRLYDQLDGVLPNGDSRAVFFDISEFFGKY
jgi:hypothetical protein